MLVMLRRFSINLAIITMIIDSLLVLAGISITTFVIDRQLTNVVGIRAQFSPFTFIVFPIIWWVIFLVGSLYDNRRNLRIVDELTSFLLLSLLATISLAGILYLAKLSVHRTDFLTFVVLTIFMQLLARIGLRIAWRTNNHHANGNGIHKILIIGAGGTGQRAAAEIQKFDSGSAIQIVGFLDDDPQKLNQPEVLGRVMDAQRVITDQHITGVLIALPDSAHKVREELIDILKRLLIDVWVIPDVFRLALYRPRLETFAGMPMLDLRAPAINDYQRLAKRIFDLFAASILVVFTSPIMLLIAILIRRDSEGPALFRQERIGENRKPFKMYKFRTMVQDADKLAGTVQHLDINGNILHKTPDDQRITRVGRFLRRTSMDELPQLYNVLKGEMSLVGPRPELPYLVENYQPWQYARFAVPPGLTGWWQINGRSNKPMHLHTEDDIYYVQNCTIWLDIQILLKTVIVVLFETGAF